MLARRVPTPRDAPSPLDTVPLDAAPDIARIEDYAATDASEDDAADREALRTEGFELLRRIEETRREHPPGWTGDLDALESLVWRLLFVDLRED